MLQSTVDGLHALPVHATRKPIKLDGSLAEWKGRVQGLKLKFSLLLNDNDGSGRRGWLEYNSGIGASKDSNLFGDLFLEK